MLRVANAVTAVLALALLAPSARAQERDPAAAQALFDEAQALMNAKRFAEACPKLAESLRLDPGIGTQFHLASCHEHEGKLASAWAAFLEVASLAAATGQDARAKAAKRRAALLEPRLPKLKIVVPPVARASGLEVTRDGVMVGQAQWDLALPVDPGDHQVEVTAPGRRAFAGAVTVAEGATATLQVPQLEAATEAPAAKPLSGTPVPEPEAAPAPVQAQPSPVSEAPAADASSGPPALAIVLGVGGVVFVGAGAALGLVAGGKNDDSKKHCDPDDPNLCGDRGVELRDDAYLFGNLATVGFLVGGAAIATAAVLWITSDDTESAGKGATVSLAATPSSVGVRVSGRL
jgi:hypothetical protein